MEDFYCKPESYCEKNSLKYIAVIVYNRLKSIFIHFHLLSRRLMHFKMLLITFSRKQLLKVIINVSFNFRTFQQRVTTTGKEEVFKADGKFTFFIPEDEGFKVSASIFLMSETIFIRRPFFLLNFIPWLINPNDHKQFSFSHDQFYKIYKIIRPEKIHTINFFFTFLIPFFLQIFLREKSDENSQWRM